jgi:hypothetical protein
VPPLANWKISIYPLAATLSLLPFSSHAHTLPCLLPHGSNSQRRSSASHGRRLPPHGVPPSCMAAESPLPTAFFPMAPATSPPWAAYPARPSPPHNSRAGCPSSHGLARPLGSQLELAILWRLDPHESLVAPLSPHASALFHLLPLAPSRVGHFSGSKLEQVAYRRPWPTSTSLSIAASPCALLYRPLLARRSGPRSALSCAQGTPVPCSMPMPPTPLFSTASTPPPCSLFGAGAPVVP